MSTSLLYYGTDRFTDKVYTTIIAKKKHLYSLASYQDIYTHPFISNSLRCAVSHSCQEKKTHRTHLIVMHHKIKKHIHMEKQIKQSRFFYSKIKQSRLCYQTRRSGSDLRQAPVEGWPRPAGVSPGPFRLPRCAHLPICAHEGMWM